MRQEETPFSKIWRKRINRWCHAVGCKAQNPSFYSETSVRKLVEDWETRKGIKNNYKEIVQIGEYWFVHWGHQIDGWKHAMRFNEMRDASKVYEVLENCFPKESHFLSEQEAKKKCVRDAVFKVVPEESFKKKYKVCDFLFSEFEIKIIYMMLYERNNISARIDKIPIEKLAAALDALCKNVKRNYDWHDCFEFEIMQKLIRTGYFKASQKDGKIELLLLPVKDKKSKVILEVQE